MLDKIENTKLRQADKLFDQIRSGDQKALELLFSIYFPRLNDFARKLVKDDIISQDIVQDVFVKIWERRVEIEVINIEAFVFKMVRNQCIDYIKQMRVIHNRVLEIEISSKYEELYRIDFIGDKPYVLIEKELHEIIDKTVNKLPTRCREVFILSRVNRLKNREIADKLNINIKNVERHINRALQFLRENLHEEFSVTFILLFIRGIGL